MGERLLPIALFLAIGIVAYREMYPASGAGNFPPRPSVFVGVALVYTILALVAVASPGLAAAFAVAFDIGLVIKGGAPTPVNLKVLQGGAAAPVAKAG